MGAEILWQDSTFGERERWLQANGFALVWAGRGWSYLPKGIQAKVQQAHEQQTRRNWAALGVAS